MIVTNHFNPLSMQPTASRPTSGQANFADNLTENLNDMSIMEIFDKDTPNGPHDKMTNEEFQRDWLSKALQLPEGKWWNDEQLMAHLEQQTAPILFSFEELFARFGIDVNWTYDAEGNQVAGIVENNSRNHFARMRMDEYINSIINHHARNPTHPTHRYLTYASSWEERLRNSRNVSTLGGSQ
ncbi:MAG: hypothetical protein FWG68_01215 [Defluviitaleaceae bacterium]|nr:hypothetical protein [Defluviitaleaceae bacterium]